MSDYVSNWSENVVDNVYTGIALENIPAFSKYVNRSLQLRNEENFKKLEAKIEEISRDCKEGDCISTTLDYTEGVTRNFAALHCAKDLRDGTVTIAYAVHSITFQTEDGGNAITELSEDYQKREAAERLRQLGFNLASTDLANGQSSSGTSLVSPSKHWIFSFFNRLISSFFNRLNSSFFNSSPAEVDANLRTTTIDDQWELVTE